MSPVLLTVTGQRRSGTTLLANLLDAQPGAVVRRDFLGIARFPRGAGHPPLDAPLDADQRASVLTTFRRQNRRLELPPAGVAALDALALPVDGAAWSLADLYRHVLTGLAGPDHVVAGHKTTGAERVVEALLDAVPAAHVAYMVRDPRDVVVSGATRFPDEPLTRLIDVWRRGVATMQDLTRRRPDLASRIWWVRYDDLVADPTGALAALAAGVGLGAVAVPDELSDYGSSWANNSSFGLRGTGISAEAVGRRSQAPALARRVEVELGPLIDDLGWGPVEPPTLEERVRQRAGRSVDATLGLVLRATAGVDRRARRARSRLGRQT